METEFEVFQMERGPVARVHAGGVSQAALMHHESVSTPMATFADQVARIVREYHPDVQADRIRSATQPVLAALGAAIDAEAVRLAEHEAAGRVAMTPPPSVSTDRHPEHRGRYIGKTIAEQMAMLKSASTEQLAAIVEAPDLAGLHEEAVKVARDRAMRLFHVERAGTQADFRRQPSMEGALIVTGPDVAAAEADAEQRIAEYRQRGERFADAEASLRAVIMVLATVTGWTPEEVLSRALDA